MTYYHEEVARYRIQEARDSAAQRRLARSARQKAPVPNTGVIDAVGHGLIAMGSRLVRDPTQHPVHRRAA